MKQMENNTIARIKTKQPKALWMGSVAEQKRENYQGILNGTIEIPQSEWKRKKYKKKKWTETQRPEALYKMI